MASNDVTTLWQWHDASAILISGDAPSDFLQGYLTNDFGALGTQHLSRTALCNLKGRVVANGWVFHQDSDAAERGLVLITHASLATRVIEFLTPYARFSRCQLSLSSRAVVVYSNRNEDPRADTDIVDGWRFALESVAPGTELQDASAAINRGLIDAQLAWISAPVSETFLPQMLGLDKAGAIDFAKGCYLGQEVVARAQFRGAVKRQLSSDVGSGIAPIVGAKHEQHGHIVAASQDSSNDTYTVLAVS